MLLLLAGRRHAVEEVNQMVSVGGKTFVEELVLVEAPQLFDERRG